MSFLSCRRGRNLIKRSRRLSTFLFLLLGAFFFLLIVALRSRKFLYARNRNVTSLLDEQHLGKEDPQEGFVSRMMENILEFPDPTRTQALRVLDYNSVVIITAVNNAFRTHLTNLKCSLERLGLSHKLKVVALDSIVAEWAERSGFNVLKPSDVDEKSVITGDARFGSASFNLLSKRKIAAVSQELSAGRNVLFTDADMFWCGNALREIVEKANSIPEADLLMQSAWPRSLLNSGFYFVRASSQTRNLFSELLKHEGSEENDQVIFNRVLCQKKEGGSIVHRAGDKFVQRKNQNPLGCNRNGTFAAVLNRNRYPTGGEIIRGQKIFHLSRNDLTSMCERQEFMVLHNNCIFSDKKTARFIVKGFWYVAENEITCLKSPLPITKEALKRCGKPKCGKIDSITFRKSLKLK